MEEWYYSAKWIKIKIKYLMKHKVQILSCKIQQVVKQNISIDIVINIRFE